MYGQTMGALNVYSRTTLGGAENRLFSKTNEVGDYWSRIDIQIRETQPFQIVIEGVVGTSYLGDIAVDDVTFSYGCKIDNSSHFKIKNSIFWKSKKIIFHFSMKFSS